MTMPLWVANVASWWLQTCVLVLIGGTAATFLLRSAPRLRLLFFQGMLVSAALLPLLEPWQMLPAPAAILAPLPLIDTDHNAPAPALPSPTGFNWADALLLVLLAGATARLAWLGLGLLRLRRWRGQGERLLVEGVSPNIAIRLVDGLHSPASFGWSAPVILIPRQWPDGALRYFAIQHELAHILRADWPWSLGEQFLGAVLWFHPATWWLLSRIQLSREQAVDECVAGPDRQEYLSALLTSAGFSDTTEWPVTSFLSRRQMLARVAHLTQKETSMPKLRVYAAACCVLAITLSALAIATMQFPLLAQDLRPPASMRMERLGPIAGSVVLDLMLNDKGEVEDVRVLTGPAELRPTALQIALAQAYGPGQRSQQLTIYFVPSPSHSVTSSHTRASLDLGEVGLAGIDYSRVPSALQGAVKELIKNFRIGHRFSSAELKQLEQTLLSIDPALRLLERVQTNAISASGYDIFLVILADSTIPYPTAENSRAPKLLAMVEPNYPPLAKQARVQGTVRFNAHISPEGAVDRAVLVAGHPLLVQAALEAVTKYRYSPTIVDGKAVPAQALVDVSFRL